MSTVEPSNSWLVNYYYKVISSIVVDWLIVLFFLRLCLIPSMVYCYIVHVLELIDMHEDIIYSFCQNVLENFLGESVANFIHLLTCFVCFYRLLISVVVQMTSVVSWKKGLMRPGRNVTIKTMMSCNQRWALSIHVTNNWMFKYCFYDWGILDDNIILSI